MMTTTQAYAAYSAAEPLKSFQFDCRDVGEHDVLIKILYCGICHSDIHSARGEWGDSVYPLVPGHEIIGVVEQVGKAVKKFTIGDKVGVGCFVDSCRDCEECQDQQEQFCEQKILTYNSHNPKTNSMTYGGYASNIVVDEHFVLSIPDNLDLAATAPLLCAGITTYSPLRHWQVSAGDKVGVVGLGGLGHVAIKLAKAMGAHVTVFTTSASKIADAKQLGADTVVLSKNKDELNQHRKSLNLIINTVSAPHNLDTYLELLKRDGTMVLVGLPSQPHPAPTPGNIIFTRRSISGSLVGGLKETQEMLNFCGQHNITADIELTDIQDVNTAYERTLNSDVKYRFVIDMKSLAT